MKTLPHVIALSAIVAGFPTLAGLPIAAAAEPGKPIELFNGKDLTGWRFHAWPWGTPEDVAASRSKWKIGTASFDPKHPKRLLVSPGGHDLVNVAAHHGDSCDVYTDAKFGDAVVDLEFMVARGSNSGVALLGVYRDPNTRQLRHQAAGRRRHGGRLQPIAAQGQRREETGRVATPRHQLPRGEIRPPLPQNGQRPHQEGDPERPGHP